MTIPFDEAAPQLLEDFAALTDVVLRTRSEPSGGLFIAEGAITIERAFCSGARPRAVLCEEKWLDSLPSFAKDVPIIVGTQSELRS
ncbi:MAG: rRNA methyltransferase, partial [Actinobacteria bacterium]|nr:rRNA methyltransferase [Actinomycetota bacterium]